MSFALVGLAIGLGARYPRFNADPTQVAGSYGGVAFMIQAVLFVIVMIGLLGWPASIYLFQHARHLPLTTSQQMLMTGCFASAAAISLATWLTSMRSGVRALQAMGD
jgi:SNF family Na+-dependent transporter